MDRFAGQGGRIGAHGQHGKSGGGVSNDPRGTCALRRQGKDNPLPFDADVEGIAGTDAQSAADLPG